MRSFKLVFLVAAAAGFAAAQPSITGVANAASNLAQGLPNSGIAPGSIFIVQGTGLGPSTLVEASPAFESITLADTSVSITVGSTTVAAPMYYTSAAQLAALLPSETPTGTGSLTVTYQGSPSTAFTVTVVANNIGVFTVSQDGQGLAIATFPDYSLVSAIPGTGALADTCTQQGQACPYTYSGAPHPGDVVTLWATGLGAVAGGDGTGSLGQTNSVAMTLWVGGVSVPISYQGRSGCCIGEDQIVFTMPNNAPTGCAVPVILQIGALVSNSTLMPIASSGRACTPQSPALTSSIVQALTTATGPVNISTAQAGRQIFSASSSGTFYEDYVQVGFGQVSFSYNTTQNTQPLVLSSLDSTPPGTCMAYNAALTGNPLLVTNDNGLDAGTLTITGPLGPTALSNHGGDPEEYGAVLSGQGTYFSAGTYVLSGGPGRDIGQFSVKFTITQTPTWQGSDQNRLINAGVTRANGMTINWTGGSAAYSVVITGSSFTDGTGTNGASFECVVPSTLNTFTVPPQVLLALPGGPYSEVDFRPALPAESYTANNLDMGILNFHYQTSVFPPFN